MGEQRRAALIAVVAVLGGVVLVAVLVTWAASIGPSGVLRGDGPEAVRMSPSESTSSPADPFGSVTTDDRGRLVQEQAGDPTWLRTAALVLEAVVAAALLWLLGRAGLRAWQEWRARQRPAAEPGDVDFDVLTAPARLGERIEHDAGHQRDLLLGGSPRNGIVECWHRFEVQAADAGLAPHTWETSSEFTFRMLDLVGADAHAVARLAALYREARFSEHPLDESARAEALDALDAVHRGLRGTAL